MRERAGLVVVALALAGAGCGNAALAREAARVTGGDPARGRRAMRAYGCSSCHTIPGVDGADGQVGPPLGGIASRVFLAGRLFNTPENLQRWVRHPQQVEPGTAMPETGLGDQDSRDIAAYLYTLR